jgi:hypothetical protein
MISTSKLIRPAAGVLAAGLLGLAAAPAQAITIVTTFDSSVSSLANAAAVESAFNTVANDYATSFANPVTVNLTVSWGSVAGQSLPTNAVGASVDNLYGYYSYAQIRDALAATAAANPSDTALVTALNAMPATGPSGVSQYAVASAEAKALGLIADQATTDGYIGFAGSTSGYDFNPLDGVATGTYDFEGVAAHELAEVLGRISGLYSPTPSFRTPFDLFRYKAAGVLDFGYNDGAYFSINGGVKKLANFNSSRSGGDRGDWTVAATSTDAQGAFIATGRRYNLTNVDLTALDVLGWTGSNAGDTKAGSPAGTAFALATASVPEPATWAMLVTGFAGLGAVLRRRRRALV